jgi:hypothetical protein
VREFHVLNLGAGVQSSALFLLANEGKLKFDVAIVADTQEEPQSVYLHLEYLKRLERPPIWVRSAGRLGDDLRNGRGPTRRFASIPAFTRDNNGRVGIVRRQCSAEYKVEVIEKSIRRELLGLASGQRLPREVLISQAFGISIDERGRAERIRRRYDSRRQNVVQFPLLDLGWSRTDCIAYLRSRLPHQAPRSACVFCPYHTNREWALLRQNDPEGWSRAVQIDRTLRTESAACNRNMRQPMFLHRSCQPLDQIDFGVLSPETVHPMTVGDCHGLCGV